MFVVSKYAKIEVYENSIAVFVLSSGGTAGLAGKAASCRTE